MNAIFKRRSIRKYREEKISDEDITLLLRAAMSAPSAGNEQPWEFIVVRNRESMIKITEFHPFSQMLHQADTAIIICGNRNYHKYPTDVWVQDCSAATENILIQAADMGIGAVWLGVYPRPERIAGLKELFALPEEVTPVSIVSLGYPAEEKKEADRFRPERVHYEKW
jgi:nitroreductase